MTLAGIDVLILALYLAGMVGLSWAFARKQRSGEEYFLAGRAMPGWVLAASILANQASAVSLVGAPAFVALRDGGGLIWLQYEIALPLAMLLLIALLLPAIRSVPGSSIYAYAEARFGRDTRRALAGAFLLSRGLALGVVLYASALVVAQALGWPLEEALLLIGLFSAAYTGLGGIQADIWSDVLQLVLLWGGITVSAIALIAEKGAALLEAVPEERMRSLVLDSAGVFDGSTFSFWPMVMGGVFLYVSYYGCDQSQAQRLLTARSDGEARSALLLNGLLRFPLVLTYCGLGLLLAALLRLDPAFAKSMTGLPADSLVPVFLTTYLPAGLRGLLLAAILAAAMSSIDSALNSLAAVTLEDVCGLAPSDQGVWIPRIATFGWGAFSVVSGIAFARAGTGVIELINLIGSAFYGPVLAVFALGVCAPAVGSRGAMVGLGTGLAGNLLLARYAPGLSWLWWNPAGFALAVISALLVSGARPGWPGIAWPRRESAVLGTAFVVMLGILLLLQW
jgi:SSS family solute:Na+ symporter